MKMDRKTLLDRLDVFEKAHYHRMFRGTQTLYRFHAGRREGEAYYAAVRRIGNAPGVAGAIQSVGEIGYGGLFEADGGGKLAHGARSVVRQMRKRPYLRNGE